MTTNPSPSVVHAALVAAASSGTRSVGVNAGRLSVAPAPSAVAGSEEARALASSDAARSVAGGA